MQLVGEVIVVCWKYYIMLCERVLARVFIWLISRARRCVCVCVCVYVCVCNFMCVISDYVDLHQNVSVYNVLRLYNIDSFSR